MSRNVNLVVIDIGLSNIRSVVNAFNFLGADSSTTDEPSKVLNSDVIVLPGVGSFRQAKMKLDGLGLSAAIKECANRGDTKILGICLGLQLLCRNSAENGTTNGLNIIPAEVRPFRPEEVPGGKIPHVGFNSVSYTHSMRLFDGLPMVSDFYFVHSHRIAFDEHTRNAALCHHGIDFVAAYEKENIFATQFHPEKSQASGLHLLRNFLKA